MITLLSVLAGLVAVATGMAMLHDATPKPDDQRPIGWFRHVLRLTVLVCITATGGVVACVPQARAHSVYQAIFSVALAAFMALQSPCPWWAYVLKGRVATLKRTEQAPPPEPTP